MNELSVLGLELSLLPEKAVYIESLNSLLVADLHLGKSETFQSFGIPISPQVNQQTLARLRSLCEQIQPERVFVLGDLFHSKYALTDEVLASWKEFVGAIAAEVTFVVGNHDRRLVNKLKHHAIACCPDDLHLDSLLLSHEPTPTEGLLNICGHIHPCLRLESKLDSLRLPCFFYDRPQQLLVLPSFGEFTGGYEITLTPGAIAYVIADNTLVPFEKM